VGRERDNDVVSWQSEEEKRGREGTRIFRVYIVPLRLHPEVSHALIGAAYGRGDEEESAYVARRGSAIRLKTIESERASLAVRGDPL